MHAGHDYYNWKDPSFRDYIEPPCSKRFSSIYPSPSFAHDSRGFAWAMWEYATPNHTMGFRDYTSTSRSIMNWRIVRGIRATGHPVGATVKKGKHEILAVGFKTYADPKFYDASENLIYGFRVWDPWYESTFPDWGAWPTGGIAPSTYITIDDWDANYFKQDANEGPHYDGLYVAVLRSVGTANPDQNISSNYGDWWFQSINGHPPYNPASNVSASTSFENESVELTVREADVLTEADASNATISIGRAIQEGLASHDLVLDPDYGSISPEYSVGRYLRVESSDPEWPSYFLVEIVDRGSVAAVAIVNDTGIGGLRFGELAAALPGTTLAEEADLQARAVAAGLTGQVRLMWASTERGNGRFAPLVAAQDASGELMVLTAAGVESADRFLASP